MEDWQLGADGHNTQLGGGLIEKENEKLMKKLADNKDLFAWMTEDISSIDPWIMSHRLAVCTEAKSVA